MRVKKVNRYYCDFCKKAGCAGGHMKKHESRCTMNPNRVCGYCKLTGDEQPDIVSIIKLLPDTNNPDYRGEYGEYTELFTKAIADILPVVREKTNNCPACIMAVFRQAHIPLPLVKDFDFAKECKSIWDDFNYGNANYNF